MRVVLFSVNIRTSFISINNLSDHYSGGRIPKYDALESSLLRIYSYSGNEEGIEPESLVDITDECDIIYLVKDSLRISVPPSTDGRYYASVMVSFTIFYPDIFSPHLMKFQRDIIRQYADVPLAGVCKDEWGFSPYFPKYADENTYDYWYSKYRAQDYAARTSGR